MSNADADVVKAAAEKPIAELPDDIKQKIPEKAWIVEIRGYTYHHDAEEFIKHTFLENLRHPDLVNPEIFKKATAARQGNNRVPETPREKLFKEQILDQISFLFLYKNEEVPNPEPGNFAWIKGSYLPGLVKNGNAVNGPAPAAVNAEGAPVAPTAAPKIPRDTWKPIGEIASMAHAAGLMNVGAQPIGAVRKDPNMPLPKVVVEKQARREFVVLFVWKEPLRTLEPAATLEAKKD